MPESAKTAVVAEPSAAECARLYDLLVTLGFSAVSVADEGLTALKLVEEKQPDVLLASATLRPSDGVWLAKMVLGRPLRVRPAIVLTRVSGLLLPGASLLASHGAAIVDRPVTVDALLAALQATDVRVRRLPEAFCRRRDGLLDRLSVPDHEGRRYLETAVDYVWLDMRLLRSLTGALYPMVARRHGVSARKVEQGMRYAIELAWKHGKIDEQYRIFRGTIDAQRGKPTCGEMIAQVADILRMEGIQE